MLRWGYPRAPSGELGKPTIANYSVVNGIDYNGNECRNNHCSHNNSSDADEHGALHGADTLHWIDC
jgi:hypothetical protein